MLAKGSNMHHMRTWVVRLHGDEGWERVVAALGPEDAATVRSEIGRAHV